MLVLDDRINDRNLFSDIIKVVLIENNELKVVFTFSKSIMAGVTSLFFGITLIRLQDSFGVLSKYAGIAGNCSRKLFNFCLFISSGIDFTRAFNSYGNYNSLQRVRIY